MTFLLVDDAFLVAMYEFCTIVEWEICTGNMVMEKQDDSGIDKFRKWLNSADPTLASAFDCANGKYDMDVIEAMLVSDNISTQHFTKFILAIWHNSNRYQFDLIEAVPVLSQRHYDALQQWLRQPFWA